MLQHEKKKEKKMKNDTNTTLTEEHALKQHNVCVFHFINTVMLPLIPGKEV